MATRQRVMFEGLNSDVDPTRLPSGACDDLLNVEIEDGTLKKRYGFEAWDTGLGAIKNMAIAEFANGDVYVVVKAGSALKQRKVYPADAGSFTTITTEQTHNANDRGWFGMMADRLHYFDRGGGTRWHPDNLSTNSKAYKAGILRCTTGPTLSQAAGGEKDGWYRVYAAFRNSVTREEGMVSGPVATAIECRLEDPDDKSGLAVDNWADIKGLAASVYYEVDQVHFYCTNGNTDYTDKGVGAQIFSHRAYDDVVADISDGSVGLNKADSVHDPRDRFSNAGGEPPGSQVGCFSQAGLLRGIYGKPWLSGSLVPDLLMFSIPAYPTMVPQAHEYSQGGDSKTFEPLPYRGEIPVPVPGGPTAIISGGGMTAAYSRAATYLLQEGGLGPPSFRLAHPSKGAAGPAAAVGTPVGLCALGDSCWTVLTGGGFREISQRRCRATLTAGPVAQRADYVAGYYSHRNQFWAAIAKSGESYIRRILVFDPGEGRNGAVLIFEPANIGSTESITAMCELPYGDDQPSMLVATDGGDILRYPSTTITDGATGFASHWQGYFGQERIAFSQGLEMLRVHCGQNCADNVTWSLTCLQMASGLGTDGSEVGADTGTLYKDSRVVNLKAEFTHRRGNVFRIKFSDDSTVDSQWEIQDMTWMLKRLDK